MQLTDDPAQAAKGGADALYTDVWTSMGQEEERAAAPGRLRRATPSTTRSLEQAAPDVVVLHCLPAHRGEEISDAVLEGPHSVVWRQAAHRQTAMRGILAWVTSAAPEVTP